MDEQSLRAEAEQYGMQVVYLGLLRKGPAWTAEETVEQAALQKAHLANINAMAAKGWLVLVGPMGDDGDLRGIYVFKAGSLAEAEAMAASDPAIQAGRLICEMHPWLVGKDALR